MGGLVARSEFTLLKGWMEATELLLLAGGLASGRLKEVEGTDPDSAIVRDKDEPSRSDCICGLPPLSSPLLGNEFAGDRDGEVGGWLFVSFKLSNSEFCTNE